MCFFFFNFPEQTNAPLSGSPTATLYTPQRRLLKLLRPIFFDRLPRTSRLFFFPKTVPGAILMLLLGTLAD